MKKVLLSFVAILIFTGCSCDRLGPEPAVYKLKQPTYDNLGLVDWGWSGNKGVQISMVENPNNAGDPISVSIEGISESGQWNFAWTRKISVGSKEKYRASGEMLVKKYSDSRYPPRFSFQVHKGDKWISNHEPEAYDLQRLNTWQKFSVEFSLPEGENLELTVKLDKISSDPSVSGEFEIRQIRVERLLDKERG